MTDNRLIFKNSFLDVDLFYGINILDRRSASGKTYFSKVYSKLNADFAVMSVDSESLYSRFIQHPWNLGTEGVIYFFDRFDYFNSKRYVDLILSNKEACILIDLKETCSVFPAGTDYCSAYILRKGQKEFEVKNGFLQ